MIDCPDHHLIKRAVIDNERDMQRILDACREGGSFAVCALSTMGVVAGAVRVIMAPLCAFEGDAPGDSDAQWMERFRAMKDEPRVFERDLH